MKKFFCTIWLLLCLLRLNAQNITAAEYFFNADPGVGSGNPIPISAPGAVVNFTASIPTTSLGSGFHTLAIRTKDDNNIWSLFESRAIYVSSATSDAASIVAAEYFIDTDPGAGAGVPINVGTAGNSVSFSIVIPTTSLSTGFHTLAIRTRDADGLWGLFETRAFYIASSSIDAGAITAAEYFIDADPGAGNGTAMNIGVSGNVANFIASVPTTSLAAGFHTLAIRVRNADGVWGLFEVRPFYISTTTTDAAAITAAEYFIDADPGAGSGTAVSIGASGSVVSFTAAIPTTSLANGFHVLAIRTRNADGVWGLFETRTFYISSTTANMGMITEAEYFIDTDPGVGNGAALTITTPGNTVNQTFLANVPSGTPDGQHILAIRTKDANGIWGLFEVREFTVGNALPLDWISFTAKRVESKVALQWLTENEVNTSHFVIERSRNGVDFTSLGEVTANGGIQNAYSFDDVQPRTGLNFYRLKQVDRNGAFKYSVIVKVYFGEAGLNDLKLFPQPAHSVLNVVFGGRGNSLFIQVYDAGGKMVMNERKQNNSTVMLDMTGLAKGTYWIVVSDGVTQQKGQFLKQ